jgi:hypothetical protein
MLGCAIKPLTQPTGWIVLARTASATLVGMIQAALCKEDNSLWTLWT